MPSQLGQLLTALGRNADETVSVLTQVPGQGGTLNVHWTTVREADSLVDSLVGCNVWFGVQPLDRPERGRGRATDVTGFVALYADLDWHRPGKVGMTPDEAMEFVGKLSELLGTEPVGIVASGNGIQPYWRVALCDPDFGRQLLAWWRHHVLAIATEMEVSVDSQVFDLPRILRVPGPQNLKDLNDPRKTTFVAKPGRTLTRPELFQLIQLSPAPEQIDKTSQYDRRGGDLSPRDSVRFFTPEQADRYINEHILPDLRNTPEGAGFNAALNRAAFSLAAFVPAFMSEEEASGILSDECARRWGSANAQDWATIDSGFRGCEWEAHVTPEDVASNPFYEFYESAEELPLAPERRIRENHYNPNAVLEGTYDDTVIVQLHGRDFERAKVHPKSVPTEACYLSDEFWDSRPTLGLIRDLAWATRTCPESVLMSTFARLAGNIMPNLKVHGGIGSPAALNTMALLIGPPGGGKSVSWSVAKRYVHFEGGADAPIFTPASGQGIMTMYGRSVKPKGGGASYFERTGYAAIGFLDETDMMGNLREMRGNTLSSVLRSAAMGNDLGSQTMDIDKRTNLTAGSYAFSMVACGQPLRMGWLLNADEVAGGLPQRFLWAPAVALYHPVEAGIAEDVNIMLPFECRPDPNGNAFSGEGVSVPKAEHVILAPESVCYEIDLRYRRRQMFGGDPMMAHVDLTRLKVAAYLALMSGRVNMTEEDWKWAGEVMRVSVATSQWTWSQLIEAQAVESEQKSTSRGKSDAKAAIKGEAEYIEMAALRILNALRAHGAMAEGSLGKYLSGKARDYKEDGLTRLLEMGLVEVRDGVIHLAG